MLLNLNLMEIYSQYVEFINITKGGNLKFDYDESSINDTNIAHKWYDKNAICLMEVLIKDLNSSNFNTNSVNDMSDMFNKCSSLTSLNYLIIIILLIHKI